MIHLKNLSLFVFLSFIRGFFLSPGALEPSLKQHLDDSTSSLHLLLDHLLEKSVL